MNQTLEFGRRVTHCSAWLRKDLEDIKKAAEAAG